jgi:hypothetical protein
MFFGTIPVEEIMTGIANRILYLLAICSEFLLLKADNSPLVRRILSEY